MKGMRFHVHFIPFSVHPRTCGNICDVLHWGIAIERFIPARAGNIVQMICITENLSRFIPARAGNIGRGRDEAHDFRFIPARAGNIHFAPYSLDCRFIPARAGNIPTSNVRVGHGSSPHVRGTYHP